MSRITRRVVFTGALAAASALALAGCSLSASGTAPSASETSGSTVYFGVSAAITGQYAQYGEQFKEAFDLAVEEVNADGGIDGHPVALKYEDSQSGPKQSVTVAQKFVNDPDIALVFGDYSSADPSPRRSTRPASSCSTGSTTPTRTSPRRARSTSGRVRSPRAPRTRGTADYLKDQGIDTVGVTYLNTADWGIPAYEAFKAEADKIGLTITAAEGVDPASDDYRPSLTKVVSGNPDAVVHVGYGPDARQSSSRSCAPSVTTARSTADRTRSPSTARRMPRRDQRCAVPAVEPRREGPGVRQGIHGEVPG